MTLVTVDDPTAELVTVEEAKRHLRLMSTSLDDEEIHRTIRAAREWCEGWVSRTLRGPTLRTYTTDSWPTGLIELPFPPILDIESVKYYNSANADTTLAVGNYHLVTSDGPGHLEWSAVASLPASYTRPDAVRIEYTAGYTTLPAKAKQAILLALDMFWGDGRGKDLEYAERSAKYLLGASDWGCYR